MGKNSEQPESQRWLVVHSAPMKDFLEKKHGLVNISKDKRKKEYKVSDKKHINISADHNIFLFDVVIPGVVIDTIPEETGVNKPSMVYRGGVISEKRLSAFITGQ